MPIVLESNDLRKIYPLGQHEIEALHNIDFQVQEGEFLAFYGPTGSGKSTLLHLLGGMDRPTSGQVHLAGKRLAVMDDDQITQLRRQNVGYLFEAYNLVPTLTVTENILLPLIMDGQNTRKYKDRLDRLLRLVGLTLRRGQKPGSLSTSEQRRVGLARALITKPAVVLADEPVGNLDSKSSAQILEILRRACDELGQTIVICTQDPRSASTADRIIFLRDGVILANLGLEDTLPEERYARVVAAIKTLAI